MIIKTHALFSCPRTRQNYFINYLNFVKMKKLELDQMINVNGGVWSHRRCGRVKRRIDRLRSRRNEHKADALENLVEANC